MNEFELNITEMGKEILYARRRAGLSLVELARRVGTTKTTIFDVESGTKQNGGSVALVAKIANELGLSLDALCGISAKPAEKTVQGSKDKVFEAVKTLIDRKDTTAKITCLDPFRAGLSLYVNDMGIAYFAQEYAKARETIESNKDTEYYDTVKTAVTEAFESRFSSIRNSSVDYYFEGKYYVVIGEVGGVATITLHEIHEQSTNENSGVENQ